MRKSRLVLSIVALGAIGGLAVQQSLALPPVMQARDTFVTQVQLHPIDTCSPSVGGQGMVQMGVDVVGPFFTFAAIPPGGAPALFTYRPRGVVPDNVRYFGDGGIAATEHFRKLYERWVRSAGAMSPAGLVNDHWTVPCLFGVGSTIPMVADVESVLMKTTVNGAPLLGFFVDNTNTFEDYQFHWNP